jgi:squalene-hopene/tetraprenyl-beta-curcumene cyclase
MIVTRESGKLGRGPAVEAPSRSVGTPPPIDSDALDLGLAATRRWLLDQQRDDGHWVGELEGDTILESEFVLLLTAMGREADEVAVKLCKYLYEQRLPEGGWAIYPGGPFDISASVKSYFALKLVGVHPDHPEMVKVRDRILEAGGAEACNSFTRFYLALLGQISYDDCPYVPPELIFLPTRTGLSLYDMSSWTRTMVVPLSILSVQRPVRHLPPEKGIAELFRRDLPAPSRRTKRTWSWANFFVAVDRGFKLAHRVVPKVLRKPGLAAAHRWMVRHFEGSEGLGAIFPAMVYSIFALRSLGYDDDHELVRRALTQLEDLMIEEDGAVRVQPCVSPTWDSAIAAIALADSGVPADDPSMTAAAGLAAQAPRPGADRLGLRVPQRLLPGHRRHRHGAARPGPDRPGRPARGEGRNRPGRRLAAGDAEPGRRLGGLRRRH